MRITTLIENTPGEHKALVHEHGLSFHVRCAHGEFLFDTGQSGHFMDNAAQLGIGLDALDYVVLSHGHYDHSGGLRHLAERTTAFELVTGRGFFAPKYGERGPAREYLGNNFDAAYLAEKGIRHSVVDEPLRELMPGVFAVTDFPRTHADEVVNPRFSIGVDGGFVPDLFDDEVCLALDSAKGLVVLLGCSHPGVKNMLDAVAERTGRPIHAVMGGTHLVEASDESLRETMAYLEARNIAAIGVSHCTGETAMGELAHFQERYFHNRTGTALDVD